MLSHEQLQALLDKYPDFNWGGSYSRRQKGEVRFLLGRGHDIPLKDREPFYIRALPRTLAVHLRDWLLQRIGEAVAYPGGVSDTIEVMVADVHSLDD